ncbi:unnamed protein product [Merluccius merluccius]
MTQPLRWASCYKPTSRPPSGPDSKFTEGGSHYLIMLLILEHKEEMFGESWPEIQILEWYTLSAEYSQRQTRGDFDT